MERECCLSMLITLVGGATLLANGWWPAASVGARNPRRSERILWRRIWFPLAPAFTAAAVLCGWALTEPDPVPEKVPWSLVLISVPFALLFARAVLRSLRALIGEESDPATATVGFVRPWIVFSPHLAKKLTDRQVAAALQHERAHVCHRDPLRIWLAQLATDLQWPWPQARERFRRWLVVLELARDEEARAGGIDGSDLAEAILACARFSKSSNLSLLAALTGEPSTLQERIQRLLRPLPCAPGLTESNSSRWLLMLASALMLALVLGAIFGERAVHALFSIAA